MKQILTLLLIAFLSSPIQFYGAEVVYGQVVAVTDGDTIKVLDATNMLHKVRLYGIDAPEKRQPFGQKAKQFLSSLIFGKDVKVEVVNTDRYGRSIGKIYYTENNISSYANRIMVDAGYAWCYLQYINKFDRQEFVDLEYSARQAGRGLWQDKNPIEPWNFRRTKKKH